MRRRLMAAGVLTASWLAAGSLQAAVIKGRVVDSDGRAVAGAEIRIWRQVQPMGGVPVKFGDKETLLADDTGRFETPDVFGTTTPVRIVAQAPGMLAGRSAWLMPKDDVTEVDDIVLARTRSVVGQVVDSQGAAIAGATVFDSDGHRRVEAKTGSTGRFILEEVPENALFLLAEKPGYRLTCIPLGNNQKPELRMARDDEPIEPLRSRDPVLSAEERIALAHRLLDPYLEAVSQKGSDSDKDRSLQMLSTGDPAAALEWFNRVSFANRTTKELCWGNIVLNWMKLKRAGEWDNIRALLRSSDDDSWAASSFIGGAKSFVPRTEPERRRQWLDEGLVRARALPGATSRITYVALAATGFWQIGDHERAVALAREAETEANDLPFSDAVCAQLATAFAPFDLPKALRWLDQIRDDRLFSNRGALAALDLAPIDTAGAEEIWNHVGDRAKDRAFMEVRDLFAARFCFRIAQKDLERANRLAVAVEPVFYRVQARAAVAHAVAGEKARILLRDAVTDPGLPQLVFEPSSFSVPQTAARALAAILPVAEGIDPLFARELLWRALSLRPPQPTVSLLDDEGLRADVSLARMIARYEPTIARRILQPAIDRLAQTTSPAAQVQIPVVVTSAAFVDPNWAVEVLNGLPDPPDVSNRHAKNQARLSLVRMLGLQGSKYWENAGFWEPDD